MQGECKQAAAKCVADIDNETKVGFDLRQVQRN